jgi:hypothetical protein
MSADYYADGVANVALLQGMIRIDFATLSLTEKDEDGNPQVLPGHRVIMTPQGFVKAFGTMERVMGKLVETGVVRDPEGDERRDGPARDPDTEFSAEERRKQSRDRRKRST